MFTIDLWQDYGHQTRYTDLGNNWIGILCNCPEPTQQNPDLPKLWANKIYKELDMTNYLNEKRPLPTSTTLTLDLTNNNPSYITISPSSYNVNYFDNVKYKVNVQPIIPTIAKYFRFGTNPSKTATKHSLTKATISQYTVYVDQEFVEIKDSGNNGIEIMVLLNNNYQWTYTPTSTSYISIGNRSPSEQSVSFYDIDDNYLFCIRDTAVSSTGKSTESSKVLLNKTLFNFDF